ncbi:MAG: 30S ribosome-binding factor RbfA [Myxococcota bacterium]
MTGVEQKRAVRVAERVRSELMELLLRGEVKDPGTQDVFVSGVQVSDDLSHAHVYVRLLNTEVSERRRRAAVRAMTRASGFLRTQLARRMEMKRVPELTFHWDEVVDEALRVEGILDEIRGEGDGGGS